MTESASESGPPRGQATPAGDPPPDEASDRGSSGTHEAPRSHGTEASAAADSASAADGRSASGSRSGAGSDSDSSSKSDAGESGASDSRGGSQGGRHGSSRNLSTETILGQLIVEAGLATEDDIAAAKAAQASETRAGDDAGDGPAVGLADLLIQSGAVTLKQVDRLRPQVEDRRTRLKIPGYTIMEKLGAGAMATVYKAKQLSLDRIVAIKVLPRKYTKSMSFVKRFYAEGKAAAKLNHPNIVGAYDVGQAGEFHYFVMEYVEGRTVHDDLTRHSKYAEAEALDIIIQVAQALDHAHQAGFIHRDVKPKNIMIMPSGQVKLADMGLARAVSDREAAEAEAGKAYGTPYYISPEQVRGELDVDFRADIYGLGATMYHLVTGKVPFEGANPSAVMHKHLKAKLTPPDHLNPDLSAGVGEIIEVCLSKDRNKRYNSTADLLQDLEAVRRGEPPAQARRKFDVGSLSELESTATPLAPTPQSSAASVSAGMTAPGMDQPIFWVAAAGWGTALLLLVLWLGAMLG